MQFLAVFARAPGKLDAPIPAALREAEFQKVRSLYSEGFVRQVWLRDDVSGACMIVEADSLEDVRDRAAALPLVRAGLLESPMIVPLKPYAGFAPR
jgi:uncharacterized protein YciI